jgi:rubredoxin
MILNVQIVKDQKKDLRRKNNRKNGIFIMKIHRCKRCNYLYDDEQQKIPFKEIGDEWRCPKCRSSKKLFITKEISK